MAILKNLEKFWKIQNRERKRFSWNCNTSLTYYWKRKIPRDIIHVGADEFLQCRIFYWNLVIRIHYLIFGREKLVKSYKMTTFLWRYKRRHEYNELERIVNAKYQQGVYKWCTYFIYTFFNGASSDVTDKVNRGARQDTCFVSINIKDKMLIVEMHYKLHWNMHGKARAFVLFMLDLSVFQGDAGDNIIGVLINAYYKMILITLKYFSLFSRSRN